MARRLDELPAVRTAFEGGRMTWSQVRAITRVAEPDDGVDWVDLARHSSAAQLERIVRGIRRVRTVEEAAADPERAEYRMRTRHRYDTDGNLVLTIYASAQDAPLILAGLEAQRAELDRRRLAESADQQNAPEDVPAGTPTVPVPTLVPAPAESSAEAVASVRDVPAGTPAPGWAAFPDATTQAVQAAFARYHAFVAALREDDGAPAPDPAPSTPANAPATSTDLGRSAREPSLALREWLASLAGERCRFPGCTRHRKLHAHHVVYLSAGGRTDLANMLLLCSRHHTLVHQLDFRLVLHPDRRLDVHTADGVPVLHHPAKPWGDPAELDPTGRVCADTLPATHCDDRLDLGHVVNVLLQQAA